MTDAPDPLDRLYEIGFRARCGGRSEKYQRDGEWHSFPVDEVLALVEIARAAHVILDLLEEDDTYDYGTIYPLKAALARLDNHAPPDPR